MATEPCCPYCYRPLPVRQIMFRCAGQMGPTGKKCDRRTDPVLSRQLGDNSAKFPAFEADGRRNKADCPTCQGDTTERICQFCHSTLPVHFGTAENRLIALVGAKESGKTVFMTVLLHELMNEVSRRLDAAILGADDYTRKAYFEDYENRLYRRGELHEQTQTAAASPAGVRPLVFNFTLDVRRFRHTQRRRTLLSFFDTAGEDLKSSESVAYNARYLNSADGVILLLDPQRLGGAEPPGRGRGPSPALDSGTDPMAVLDRVTELLHGSRTTRRDDRITKPVAVVFSKMDLMDDLLSPECHVQRYSPAEVVFDEEDSQAVDAELRSLLLGWHGPAMEQLLNKNYRRYRFFGVSALGQNPVRDANNTQRLAGDLLRPRRIHDPFMWLLNELHTL